MKSVVLLLAIFVVSASCRKSQPLPPSSIPFDFRREVRDRFRSDYEEEIAFIPKMYTSPFNRRDAPVEPPVKSTQVYDSLLANVTASTFDSILKVSWNGTRDPHYPQGPGISYQGSPLSDDVVAVTVTSTSFETAGNITRAGYTTAAEVQGNPNEILLTGHVRIPVPRVTFEVNVTNKDGESSVIEGTATASRDVVLATQLILNKQWKQIFVTNVAPKDAVVFRTNFKCIDQAISVCKEVGEVVEREAVSRIEASVRDALKFKLEEVTPDFESRDD